MMVSLKDVGFAQLKGRYQISNRFWRQQKKTVTGTGKDILASEDEDAKERKVLTSRIN